MSASEGALGALHTKLAEVLAEALDGQVLPAVVDEDGQVLQEETKMPVSGAVLTATIQFLKNNNITCAPSDDNALGELKRKMQERQERREARKAKPDATDLAAATEQATWLSGEVGHA